MLREGVGERLLVRDRAGLGVRVADAGASGIDAD